MTGTNPAPTAQTADPVVEPARARYLAASRAANTRQAYTYDAEHFATLAGPILNDDRGRRVSALPGRRGAWDTGGHGR